MTTLRNHSNPCRNHNPLRQLAFVLATAGLLFNCSTDQEKIAPLPAQAATDGVARDTPEPVAIGSPLREEKSENLSGLLFPQNDHEAGRISAFETVGWVDFNNAKSLSVIPDQAYYTFATWPFYAQQVGSAWIHVKENDGAQYAETFRSDYGHYHLSYQNFLPCNINDNGTLKFGKPAGDNCTLFDPVKEPRKVDTHYGDQWIKLYAYDAKTSQRVFSLLGITITKGPVQLWYKLKNGTWKGWNSLPVGVHTITQAKGITEVLISGASSQPIGFDNVKVGVPPVEAITQ